MTHSIIGAVVAKHSDAPGRWLATTTVSVDRFMHRRKLWSSAEQTFLKHGTRAMTKVDTSTIAIVVTLTLYGLMGLY